MALSDFGSYWGWTNPLGITPIYSKHWNVPTPLGSKFKPNPATKELVGAKSLVLLHQEANFNGAGTPLTPGTALTQTTFDTTTRANQAKILLTNGSAHDEVILACAILGQPVYRLSSGSYTPTNTINLGFITLTQSGSTYEALLHDKYVNYESIAMDGDKLFELGNNMVCLLTQVNKLADIWWKRNKTKRHIYTIRQVGINTYFEPGEWYMLQVGSAGKQEYINSVVEVYAVRTTLSAGQLGTTEIDFREILQNWVFDSNETARMLASGSFVKKDNGRIVTVGASTFIGSADYYCDGTADDVEINAAINVLQARGGGTVHLTGGTFNTTASINLSFGGMILEGEGDSSSIIPGSDFGDIISVSPGSSVQNVVVRNLRVTMTNISSHNGIYFQNVINGVIMNATCYDCRTIGIYSDSGCTDCQVVGCRIDGLTNSSSVSTIAGILCGGNRMLVQGNFVTSLRKTGVTGGINGIGVFSNTSQVINNYVYDCSCADNGSITLGITIGASNCIVSGNKIEKMKNAASATSAIGLNVSTGSSNSLINNYCYNNGADTGIANTNSNNFKDNGTDTQYAG
jgi:hypothetical protein